ncbi:Wall-associated receptor kinase, galacturonan-binding domain [Sesbania bispinosa]|nr:Wall-associated receptor kinase, galacturonan-binding domain [Sesbania bispinosa]
MKPLLQYPCSILIFSVITLVISINIPTSLGEDDSYYYTNCNTAFTCEGSNIKTLKYPFFGGNRDWYCGQPGLDLICEDSAPKMTINSIKYRILDWDSTTQKLKVARDDYYSSSVCSVSDYKNTTFDNTLFEIQYDGGFVTLLYSCTSTENFQNQNPYRSDCGESKTVYYVLEPLYSPLCSASIVIPILGQQVSSLASSPNRIDDALKQGFELRWTGDYRKCTACIESGGECGYYDGAFRCLCKIGTHTSSCTSEMASPPSIFFPFLITTIILNQIPKSSSADNVQYLKCSSSFNCANLKNLSYPFWGSTRPQYCGHPAFKLECTGEVARVTIMSESYRVLEVSDSNHELKVVRNDYWNNICPTTLKNTTLGCSLFDYGSDSQNLTLYYDCPSPTFPLPDSFSPQFNCSINGTQMLNYFVMESILENAETSVSLSEIMGTCKSRVIVPILESEAKVIETNSTVENLKAALDNGFGLEWNANNSLCDECQNSGGHCGYDPSSREFTCYCKDGTFPSSCRSGEYQLYCHNTTFNCGTITNLSYPFTGGDRPFFCGPPQFHLTCNNGVPELNISSVSYRVLQINSVTRTLTLARLDLWNNTCTHNYVNSTFDETIFSYGSGNRNLTLFYGCKATTQLTSTPDNLFHCEINGNKSDSYSLVGPFPLNPVLSIVTCDDNVGVAILEEQVDRLVKNRSLLREILMKGFNVNYSNPYDNECSECLGSGGQCGFDSDNNEPICVCGDRLCTSPGSSLKRNWRLKIVIGEGGYGVVYKARLSDGRPVAVKVISDSKGNGEEFINEVASISRTSHVNIVSLLGFCYDMNKRVLIYEFMPNGSLDNFINKTGSPNVICHFDCSMLYKVALGVARGLEYLHRGCNTRILHLDIKPQNILLDEDFCPKISDFGLAKICQKKESIVSILGTRGTPGYIAPEVFSRAFGGVSHKSDVYSYGMLILEMVGGRKNYDNGGSHTSEMYFPDWIYNDLEQGNIHTNYLAITEEENEMVRKITLVSLWCIQTNPSDRPSMSKVVEMLEGPLQQVPYPPKPILYSLERSPLQISDISSDNMQETNPITTQKDGSMEFNE